MIFDYGSYGQSPTKDLELIKEIYARLCEWAEIAERQFNLSEVTVNQSIAYDVIRKSYEDYVAI